MINTLFKLLKPSKPINTSAWRHDVDETKQNFDQGTLFAFEVPYIVAGRHNGKYTVGFYQQKEIEALPEESIFLENADQIMTALNKNDCINANKTELKTAFNI